MAHYTMTRKLFNSVRRFGGACRPSKLSGGATGPLVCASNRMLRHSTLSQSFLLRQTFLLPPTRTAAQFYNKTAWQQAFAPARLSSTTGALEGRKFDNILFAKPEKHLAHLELNSPKSKNSFSLETGKELMEAFDLIDSDSTIRCAIISGNGPDFTSGVDLKSFMGLYQQLAETEDVACKAKLLHTCIRSFQEPFIRMKRLSKPIICVSHGLCLGLGMELAACSDIRYCSIDTTFAIREVLIGIAADVGSLQLMPHLVSNQSLLRELIYTGRNMTIEEVGKLNFISQLSDTKDDALIEAFKTAKLIASRSPIGVQGSKRNLEFSLNKPFEVGLDFNAVWNMSMLQGDDVSRAISAIFSKSEQRNFETFYLPSNMTKLSLNLYKLLFLFNAINCLLIVCRSEEVQVSQNELASDDGEESKVFAVNARLATGDLAQFPIFDQRYQKIDPEFKKMTLRHMDEYLGLIFGIVDKELDQPNSTNFMSWLMLSKQMVTVAVKQNKELKKLTSDYPAEKEFNLELSNLFKVGLQHSKAMAGKDVVPRISRQELKVKLHKFVETFMEIISISPTGLFMNFREGKLNDVPFPDILDETFTNLRENGFESLLGGLDKLLGFISMFS